MDMSNQPGYGPEMGLLGDLLGFKRFKDPVRGTAQVVGTSLPPHATHGTLKATLVVSADGVPSTPVKHQCMAPVAKWPSVGEQLPVTVDRAQPDKIRIEWDEVKTAADENWEMAQQIAAGGGSGLGSFPGLGNATVVSSESVTIDLSDGMDESERQTLQSLGIDADALSSGAAALRAAMQSDGIAPMAASVSQFGAASTPTPPPGERDLTSELQKLASLHASGVLTDDEFAAAKKRLLENL